MFLYNSELCVFTYIENQIKIFLLKNEREKYFLPGRLVEQNEMAIDVAKNILLDLTNVPYFMRHIAIFDKPGRDYRGNVISNIFYSIINQEKIFKKKENNFFNIDEISKLDIAYDQREIIEKAIQNLKKDLLETKLAKYFLDEYFSVPELKQLLLIVINSKQITRTHFFTKIKKKNFIEPVLDTKGEHKVKKVRGSKRPIKLYKFKDNSDVASIYF